MGSRAWWMAVGLALLLGAGCVTTRQKKDTEKADETLAEHNAKAEPQDKIVCHREHVTGSNRTERVCRRVGERRRNRDEAGDMMRRQTPGSPGMGESPF